MIRRRLPRAVVTLAVLAITIGREPGSLGAADERDEVITLPPVHVTAPAPMPASLPRWWLPGPLDVVEGQELRSSRPAVLPDLLERSPGVTLQNEQGNPFQPTLTLRGFSASPVTGLPQGISVFLDGVRLNEPTVDEVNFDLIPLDDVELIEVIRGPSVHFGRNTLGAAVNIITRRGQERLELVPEISGGSFGRQNYLLRLGGMAGPADYYVGLRYAEEVGWRDDSNTRIARSLATVGIRLGGLDATLSYQLQQGSDQTTRLAAPVRGGQQPPAELHRGRFLRPPAQPCHPQRQLRDHRAHHASGQCLRARALQRAVQRQPHRRQHALAEPDALHRRQAPGQ